MEKECKVVIISADVSSDCEVVDSVGTRVALLLPDDEAFYNYCVECMENGDSLEVDNFDDWFGCFTPAVFRALQECVRNPETREKALACITEIDKYYGDTIKKVLKDDGIEAALDWIPEFFESFCCLDEIIITDIQEVVYKDILECYDAIFNDPDIEDSMSIHRRMMEARFK